MKVLVLNGPNLNLLGMREPAIYGRMTLAAIESRLQEVANELGVSVACEQRNGEGDLIDLIHRGIGHVDGVLINAGAYAHGSLAIRDALVGGGLPFVEVHLSNIYAREAERRHSMLASEALAVVCGFGGDGYEWGLRGLVRHLRGRA